MAKYKHILDGFPYVEDVNVYDYENNFDYNLWGVNTVLRVLHVPWDISYEHVVEFETDEKRDKWVKDHTIKEYKLETAINVQPDGEIKLPIPFDVMSKCNYIVVEYPMAPIEYEKEDRISTVGYFINNIMQMAPSSTKCYVVQDYWFTYIHDVEITYMDLARGHAPMSMVDADQYLSNPINNCEYLLAPDVNYGYTLSEYTRDNTAGTRVMQISEWVANSGTIYAVVASTGNSILSYGTVGTDSMTTPSVNHANFFGCSGFDYICMKETDLNAFLHACNDYRPQYLQTIQGLFFVPEKLIELGGQLNWGEEFSDIEMYFLDTPQKSFKLVSTLNKNYFRYPSRYAKIAKLYTEPYAQIELSDEYGNVSVIAVESTNGKIEINAELNLVYPFLGLDIMVVNLNSDTDVQRKSFYGYSSMRSFSHSGEWYNNLRRYNIPSFIVCQSQSDRIKFDRYFPNKQKEVLYNTRYASDTDNADTRNSNALVGAQADKDNAYRSAITDYDNSASEAARDQRIRRSNSVTNTMKSTLNGEYAYDMTNFAAKNANAARATAVNTASIGFHAQSSIQNSQMIASLAFSPANLVGSVAMGNIEGATQNVTNAITTGLLTPTIISTNNNAIAWQGDAGREQLQFLYGMKIRNPIYNDDWGDCYGIPYYDPDAPEGLEFQKTECQNNYVYNLISQANVQTQEEYENYYNCLMGGPGKMVDNADPTQVPWKTTIIDEGTYGDGILLRLEGTRFANADTNYNAASSVAGNTKNLQYRDRDRDKAAAMSDVDYGNRNQAVDAPAIYGNAMNSETAASRPLALFVNIRTQSSHAIAAAGDQFCRFGYALNRSWIPTKLQLMKHFTYWKTNDIWIRCRGNSVEEATEVLQQIFMRGTTVWSDPDEVNSVSIYDNI